jgi:hypothetical protein
VYAQFLVSAKLITGGCCCGAVRYEGIELPYNVTHCHCIDCRRSSGAAFVTWASFSRNRFRFSQGQPQQFCWEGRLRGFCARCGTSLTFLARAEADEIDVTVSSFDQPEAVLPVGHTWVEDRLAWIHLADGLPTYAQGLPEQMA